MIFTKGFLVKEATSDHIEKGVGSLESGLGLDIAPLLIDYVPWGYP